MFDYAAFLRSCSVLLAPLAGVSDIAFRQMCLEHGAQLTFTEMVSAKGLSYANDRTVRLMDLAPGEQRVGVQLFGHEPATMASQAAWVEQYLGDSLAVIDINMGCPARKITSKGDGAALLRDTGLAREIIAQVVRAVQAPVSVKMRRAYDRGPDVAPQLARMAEDAGASAVTVHGRYATQMYHGYSCWDVIADVKRVVSIPVVGNGDIRCGADAVSMVERTGCDSVMVARGARGNPWIFEDVRSAFAQAFGNGEGAVPFASPSAHDRIEAARRQTAILDAVEPRAVVRMRKHASWYVKGLPGASTARAAFNKCETADDFYAVYDLLEARLVEADFPQNGPRMNDESRV
jgi:tRNA-dihydrouridine synthase B